MENAPQTNPEKIRAIAAKLLETAADDASIDRAATLLKAAYEAENQAAQAAKYAAEQRKLEDDLVDSGKRRLSEDRKTFIAILTPLFTTVVLAGTLIFQFLQFRSQSKAAAAAAQQQRDDAETARWNEALKMFALNKAVSPTRSLLTSFSQSPRYRSQVYDIAQNLLIQSETYDDFSSVFGDIFKPASWTNLRWILKADVALYSTEMPLTTKIVVDGKEIDAKTPQERTDKQQYERLYNEIALISSQAAPVLKGTPPADFARDLTAVALWGCDLRGADLSGYNMGGMIISQVNMDGANLSGVTSFEGLDVYSTAWWKSGLISPELLNYLLNRKGSSYNEDTSYGQPALKIPRAAYEADLMKLKRASGIQ